MKQFYFRSLAYVAVIVCTCFSADLYAGWFNSSDAISFSESKSPKAPAAKFTATIHVAKYVDGRSGVLPKNIGISTEIITNISGKDLTLDREVAELVTSSVKKRFYEEGFQIIEDGNAMYELSGVVKEFTYNVKARDEVSYLIETTVKEVATGKTIWSGEVAEKDSRFAGVSGNSKSDIANYLLFKLNVVTKKTYEAISSNLMASRPDLFNLAPGTKPISGVTVLFSSGGGQAASTVPVVSTMSPPKTTGILVLRSKPSRAKVYLDDVYFGMTPLRVEVEAKVQNASVKLDGYKTATEKLSVRKDDTTELELILKH